MNKGNNNRGKTRRSLRFHFDKLSPPARENRRFTSGSAGSNDFASDFSLKGLSVNRISRFLTLPGWFIRICNDLKNHLFPPVPEAVRTFCGNFLPIQPEMSRHFSLIERPFSLKRIVKTVRTGRRFRRFMQKMCISFLYSFRPVSRSDKMYKGTVRLFPDSASE